MTTDNGSRPAAPVVDLSARRLIKQRAAIIRLLFGFEGYFYLYDEKFISTIQKINNEEFVLQPGYIESCLDRGLLKEMDPDVVTILGELEAELKYWSYSEHLFYEVIEKISKGEIKLKLRSGAEVDFMIDFLDGPYLERSIEKDGVKGLDEIVERMVNKKLGSA